MSPTGLRSTHLRMGIPYRVLSQHLCRPAHAGVELDRTTVSGQRLLAPAGHHQSFAEAVPAVGVLRMHVNVQAEDGEPVVEPALPQEGVSDAVELRGRRNVAIDWIGAPFTDP